MCPPFEFHEAKAQGSERMTVWGTGTPRREFLHVDVLPDAAVHMTLHYSDEQIVNVGTGEDITILDVAQFIAEIVGYQGEIETDPTKPDGTPRKLLDITKAECLGWKSRLKLLAGIKQTYSWHQENMRIEA